MQTENKTTNAQVTYSKVLELANTVANAKNVHIVWVGQGIEGEMDVEDPVADVDEIKGLHIYSIAEEHSFWFSFMGCAFEPSDDPQHCVGLCTRERKCYLILEN